VIRIEDIKIDEDFFEILIHFLMNATGLNLECYHKKFVEKRIKSRMIRVNCNTLESYYQYILENSSEIVKFVECFNINFSRFFRNWEVFREFEKLILLSLDLKSADVITDLKPNPERQYSRHSKKSSTNRGNRKIDHPFNDPKKHWIRLASQILTQTSLYKKIRNQANSDEYINIWSCPCANGEEPYSIAMILDNLRNQIPNFPQFRIFASDIDIEAINRAKIGIYYGDSTKNISKYFENKYYNKKKEYFGYSYSISKEIKNQIEFIVEDVTKGHDSSLNYDVIFCRYLLIYINRRTREKFLKIIKEKLNSGGLLILGKTEAIFNSQSGLNLIDSLNRIYMKSN
jgi:chemotaxis methyl-accepting protein methylase